MFWKKKPKDDVCWPTPYECEVYTHRHNLVTDATCQSLDTLKKTAEKFSQVIAKEMPYLTSQKAYLMRRINNTLAYAAEENYIPMPDYFREEFINLRTEVSKTSLQAYATDREFTYMLQADRLVALKTAWGNYRQYVHQQIKEQEAKRLERKRKMRKMKPARVNPNKAATQRPLTPSYLIDRSYR